MVMSYLVFGEQKSTGKTKVWQVLSAKNLTLLGTIKWFGRWRQYSFYPECRTIFNRDCLREITDFIAMNKNVRNS